MVTAVYAFSHFAVDLVCAFAVFSRSMDARDYLLYNLFAFAMQMPLGLLADLLNKNKYFAIAGAFLVGLCCFSPLQGAACACLLGLGNGLFHIGGGLDVMNRSGGKAAPLGIFVSPGALGVCLGTIWGKAGGSFLPPLGALLLACAGMLLIRSSALVSNAPIQLPKKEALLPTVLLFFVVVLRSAGGAAAFAWKTGPMAFAAVCAVVLGKALGGVLADRFGPVRVSVCSLALCAVLFFFGDYAPAGLAALLLFNMTMPITLFALARLMPGAKGFSFGLLTFALFLGFLPSYFGAAAISPVVMAVIGLLSCGLLFPALKAGDGL